MGIHRGLNLIKDNLVFGYDTGYGVADNYTSTRFYKGKPVDNMATDPLFLNSTAGTFSSNSWGGDTGFAEFATNTSPDGGGLMYINHNTSTAAGGGGNYNDLDVNNWTLTNGVTYTRSWWAKSNITQTINGHMLSVNGGGNNTYILGGNTNLVAGEWKRVSHTFTYTLGTSTNWRFRCINYNQSKVYIANIQLEVGSYASPFTATSRSSTQSLIDLTKTTDIDVSNVSFSSTGQPDFDGTDDYIQIPDPNISSSNGFSIEMIIKPTNASSQPMVITPNSGGIDHFVRFNSNGRLYMRMVVAPDSSVQDFTTTTSLSSTGYHYVVFTFKQSEGGKAYYNGNQESAASANFTAIDWSNVWKIGQRGNNTFFFDGELPILKVHNKVLSANEVKQNFNAYKNRFNL